jgi:hypothetical protein
MDRLPVARDGPDDPANQDVNRQERGTGSMNKQSAFEISLGMALLAAPVVFAQIGPGSSESPYLVPLAEGVEFIPILSARDTVERGFSGGASHGMAGIPGGMGAYDNGEGTLTLLVNRGQETTAGAVRNHGARGAFVYAWQIRKSDLEVLSGEELVGNELPSMAGANWDSFVASPYEQDKTVAIGTDDSDTGKVYLHVGLKRHQGNPVGLAGLHGGSLYAVAIAGTPTELRTLPVASGTSFSLVDIDADARTHFLRPQGGAWDTRNPDRFYFVTTDRYDQVKDRVGSQIGRTRLWRLNFDSIENPEGGGTVDLLLDGTEAGQMYDNIAVDADGNVLLQEGAGGVAHNGKIWKYEPATDALTLLARLDPARFGEEGLASAAGFDTDEESSGIIEATEFFSGVAGYDAGSFRYFFVNVKAHVSAPDPGLAQKGQILLMKVPRRIGEVGSQSG